MFWGCFSWDKKGPCHIWETETTQEKTAAQKELDRINKENEPRYRQEWELSTGVRRMGLRNRKDRELKWQYTEKM